MTLTRKPFSWIHDPGHSWLLVRSSDLEEVGLKPSNFSRYSYWNGIETYALEEDCDAPIFITKWKDQRGAIEFIGHHSDVDAELRGWESIHKTN